MKKVLEEQSLLEALEQWYPDSSRRTLRNWLKAGRITVDGDPINKASYRVQKDQILRMLTQKKIDSPLPILYEDEDLVIIDKPEGLLSVPLERKKSLNALEVLRSYYARETIYAVHRIDRETSGVLVFAKHLEARFAMHDLFKNHDLIREYQAITEGRFFDTKGVWTSTLVEDPSLKVRITDDPEEGRIAITHYEVVRIMKNTTFLKLTLETGRKHQIRVHCQEAGHPILGDKRYGSLNNHYHRLCLHAHRIAFIHPFSKKKIDVVAPTIGFMKQIESQAKMLQENLSKLI